MLKKARDRLAVGPAIAWEIKFVENAEKMGFSMKTVEARGYVTEIEETKKAVRRLREVGVRVLPGGDYGLNITPHGTYAKDLEYFVDYFGMSNAESLLCATRDGGYTADPSGMLGTLEDGKLADLVIVDGNPIEDISVLQDHGRITAVMKDGKLYRGLTNDNPYLTSSEELVTARAQSAERQAAVEPLLRSASQ